MRKKRMTIKRKPLPSYLEAETAIQFYAQLVDHFGDDPKNPKCTEAANAVVENLFLNDNDFRNLFGREILQIAFDEIVRQISGEAS
jgi:hypothetical protein